MFVMLLSEQVHMINLKKKILLNAFITFWWRMDPTQQYMLINLFFLNDIAD